MFACLLACLLSSLSLCVVTKLVIVGFLCPRCTVAILAQGTNWAVAVTQAFYVFVFEPRVHKLASHCHVDPEPLGICRNSCQVLPRLQRRCKCRFCILTCIDLCRCVLMRSFCVCVCVCVCVLCGSMFVCFVMLCYVVLCLFVCLLGCLFVCLFVCLFDCFFVCLLVSLIALLMCMLS